MNWTTFALFTAIVGGVFGFYHYKLKTLEGRLQATEIQYAEQVNSIYERSRSIPYPPGCFIRTEGEGKEKTFVIPVAGPVVGVGIEFTYVDSADNVQTEKWFLNPNVC